MKPKTIKKVLRSNIDKWLASITDIEVRKIAGKNCIITGGSIEKSEIIKMQKQEMVKELQTKFPGLFADKFMENLFGDHMSVTVKRDGAIKTEDCEHD